MTSITITPTMTTDGRLALDITPLAEAIQEQIKRMAVAQEAAVDHIEYSTSDAAEMLGLSGATLSRLCREGRGPRFRCEGGRNRYFLKRDLVEWAESHPRYTSMDEYYEEFPEYRPRIEEYHAGRNPFAENVSDS